MLNKLYNKGLNAFMAFCNTTAVFCIAAIIVCLTVPHMLPDIKDPAAVLGTELAMLYLTVALAKKIKKFQNLS